MAVTTNTEYKAWIGESGSTNDTLYTTLIAVATAYAERWCDRTFDTGTRTEYYNGAGNNVIVLKNTPVTSVTSVKLMDAAGNAVTTLATTDYKLDTATGELRLTPEPSGIHFADSSDDDFGFTDTDGPAFADQFRNVQVIYVAGYADGSSPSDLKFAIWRMVDMMRGMRGKDATLKSEQIGSYNYVNADLAGGLLAFDAAAHSILSNYRRGML